MNVVPRSTGNTNSVVPCFPLLGLTPSGLFMGLSGTIIYTSELILFSTICVPSATRHNIHMYAILYRLTLSPDGFTFCLKCQKQGNPRRPIVSSNSHPTERISQFVDHHLKPLVQTTQSFIEDTTHFLSKLEQLGQLPANSLLVTLDVSSLYTNIPHNEGISACGHFLDTRDRNSSTVGTETLCDLIRMILTMNNSVYFQRQTLLTDTRYSHGNQNGTFFCQFIPRQL